jgi:hypothetical protein
MAGSALIGKTSGGQVVVSISFCSQRNTRLKDFAGKDKFSKRKEKLQLELGGITTQLPSTGPHYDASPSRQRNTV